VSPRACGRILRQEDPHWCMYNPLMECVAYRSTECHVCGVFFVHLNNATMDDDQSYIDAVSKKNDGKRKSRNLLMPRKSTTATAIMPTELKRSSMNCA